MQGEPCSTYRYAPDGLVGEALDELIDRAYAEAARAPLPTSALLNGSATEQRRRRIDRPALAAVIHPYGDGGMKPTGRYGPRPGGSNRQERARRVGAPESLIEAIEEIGMLQLLASWLPVLPDGAPVGQHHGGHRLHPAGVAGEGVADGGAGPQVPDPHRAILAAGYCIQKSTTEQLRTRADDTIEMMTVRLRSGQKYFLC